MGNHQKNYTLKPSWKQYLPHYLLCILLVPVFGIGLLLGVYVFSRHYTSFYQISDENILIRQAGKEPVSLRVAEIEVTRTEYSRLQSKTGIGTLVLSPQNDSNEYRLEGLTNPEELKSTLDTFIHRLREQNENQQEVQEQAPTYAPGTLDPMNELVGLWQQGLLSDEDFEREKKKFE